MVAEKILKNYKKSHDRRGFNMSNSNEWCPEKVLEGNTIWVDILGAKWAVVSEPFENKDYDGLTDFSTRTIKIRSDNVGEFDNFRELYKRTVRHEVLHAFLEESGLDSNFNHPEYGHDETFIDWVAIQFPKIVVAYSKLGVL